MDFEISSTGQVLWLWERGKVFGTKVLWIGQRSARHDLEHA